MANNAIWLEGWTVDALHIGKDEDIAEAHYDVDERDCPKCGAVGRLYKHGTKLVKYKDIPKVGKPFTIHATVNRYKCRECKETSMQPLPDMDPSRRMTRRLVEHLGEQGVFRNYSDLGRVVDVDEKTVRNIADDYLRLRMSKHVVDAPLVLGIDELTLLGRKRAIFTDIADKKLLDIIDTMDQQAVARWITRMPHKDRVAVVTMDMWGPYKTVVQALLPNATIVIDKWHVVSKANEKLDAVRNRYRRTAKTKRDRKNPHRGRRLLHAREQNLSAHRRFVLDGVLANNPLLKDAWEAKERFYTIWDQVDVRVARPLFDEWVKTIPASVPEFADLAATVQNHRTEVFNYFRLPFTNAYTEARNRLVKDFARAGRGYGFDKIRAKAILVPSITSEPIIVCEMCLGFFEKDAPGSSWRAHPNQPDKPRRICPRCTAGFHTGKDTAHDVSSTPKSE